MIDSSSALSALRTWHLSDGNGVVLPDGKGGFRFARASDAIDTRTQKEALELLKAAIDPNDPALIKIEENLTVCERYGQKVGGRNGALKFVEQLKDHNPTDMLFSREDKERLDVVYPTIVKDYMAEKGIADKKSLTLVDAQELNQRVRAALGDKSYRMEPDARVGARIIKQAKTIDSGVIYEATLAERIYPTLDRLYKEGNLSQEKPLYIVELGNNCAQNNMQTYLIWKTVSHWFDDRKIEKNGILMPVQLTSFGGHPQTATFDAHIEVEESEPICRRCQALVQDPAKEMRIFNALAKSSEKLSVEGQAAAKAIFEDGSSAAQKLEALLQNDLTRPIFRITVGLFSRILPPNYDPKTMSREQVYEALKNDSDYFFRGEGESPTHRALMQICGDANIPIEMEDVSTNTGENILLLNMKGDPVVIPVDFCPVGRQVVTSTHQVKNWSTVFTSLIDLPMAYYSGKLTNQQLFIETASYFAELARNILYRTADNFVSAFPIDDANYQLLWNYYAALKGYSPEESERQKAITPISTLFGTVKGAFAQFENSIPHGPVMERNDPQLPEKMAGRLKKYYAQMQARGILTDPELPPAPKGGPQIPLNKIPERIRKELGR
jgi:hypothetical protein